MLYIHSAPSRFKVETPKAQSSVGFLKISMQVHQEATYVWEGYGDGMWLQMATSNLMQKMATACD